jgi:hypothetical protein
VVPSRPVPWSDCPMTGSGQTRRLPIAALAAAPPQTADITAALTENAPAHHGGEGSAHGQRTSAPAIVEAAPEGTPPRDDASLLRDAHQYGGGPVHLLEPLAFTSPGRCVPLLISNAESISRGQLLAGTAPRRWVFRDCSFLALNTGWRAVPLRRAATNGDMRAKIRTRAAAGTYEQLGPKR